MEVILAKYQEIRIFTSGEPISTLTEIDSKVVDGVETYTCTELVHCSVIPSCINSPPLCT